MLAPVGLFVVPKEWQDTRYIVLEYIGKQDANGQNIFEADIVLIGGEDTFLVEWNEEYTGFFLFRRGVYLHPDMEFTDPEVPGIVLGNVFEQPELMG